MCLKGGAIGASDSKGLPAKKKDGNPLKKELTLRGWILPTKQVQPSTIEILPPKDMTKESTGPDKTTSSIKYKFVKTLWCKANVFDVAMQGRRSFTFE